MIADEMGLGKTIQVPKCPLLVSYKNICTHLSVLFVVDVLSEHVRVFGLGSGHRRSHQSLGISCLVLLPSPLFEEKMKKCDVSCEYTPLTFARSSRQAISCAAAYEAEWPLLIISPSSARYHWEHELLKWLDEDSITKKQIVVVCKRKQHLNRGVTKVVIISYELVRLVKQLGMNY